MTDDPTVSAMGATTAATPMIPAANKRFAVNLMTRDLLGATANTPM
jgi:hypothetical protein